MACGVHLGILLVGLVLAVHVSGQKANDYRVVQSRAREGIARYGSLPQDQLRQARIPGSVGGPPARGGSNTAENYRRPAARPTETRSQPSKSNLALFSGAPLRRLTMAGQASAAQSSRPWVNGPSRPVRRQEVALRRPLSAGPSRPWNQRHAVPNLPTAARTRALYEREGAVQAGRGAARHMSTTVIGRRVERRRGPQALPPGQTAYHPYSGRGGARRAVIHSFHDRYSNDPRYEPTVNYRVPPWLGGAVIVRLSPEAAAARQVQPTYTGPLPKRPQPSQRVNLKDRRTRPQKSTARSGDNQRRSV